MSWTIGSLSTTARRSLAVVLLAVAGCGEPINTGSAWAPNTAADRSIGRTYAWAAFSGVPAGGPEVAEIRKMVHDTIDKEIVAKGYQQGESDRADFWLVTRLARATQGDPTTQTPFEQYTEGNLYIYVVDPSTRQWLWRSWADTRLQPSNPPDVKRKRLEEAVTKMFKSFPSMGSK